MKKITRLAHLPFLWAIRVYQTFLSPDHSFWAKKRHPIGFCKFSPTCSEYGYQVIDKYGLIRGIPKIFWRIVRCNPWNKGGEDLP